MRSDWWVVMHMKILLDRGTGLIAKIEKIFHSQPPPYDNHTAQRLNGFLNEIYDFEIFSFSF